MRTGAAAEYQRMHAAQRQENELVDKVLRDAGLGGSGRPSAVHTRTRRTEGPLWSLRLMLAGRDGPGCYLCGEVLPLEEMVVEHIIPKNVGGNDHPSNLGLACSPCNNRKGRLCVSFRVADRAACYAPHRVAT